MTGGILRDLAIAAESRRDSKRQLNQAAGRLAKRIVETGRVGDRAHVGGRIYAIENVAWTLMNKEGETYESDPPAKTLAVYIGSWDMDADGTVYDTRELITLLDLTPTGADPVDSGPHFAGLASILEAEREGFYEIEGVGPTRFEPARSSDFDIFAEDAEKILADFIRCFREEEEVQRKRAEKLIGLAADTD